ncbi:MAG: hypothetical protein KDA96_14010, partial [Planctomycetaceae bacterium]|nr:hypothetical protein [Planctomycetaceae bacterium]
ADAKPVSGSVRISATATIQEQQIVRHARYGAAQERFNFNQPNARNPSVQARLVSGIQVCVSEHEAAPAVLTIGEGKPLETSRGGILKIPYQYTRSDKDSGGNLTGYPIDFPPNTTAQQVGIGANEKGEFELRFTATTVPGTYTIYLAGFCQGMQYSRNPDATENAKVRQDRIAKILEDAQTKLRELQQLSQQKQSEISAATTRLNQANTEKQQADRNLATADATVKQADTVLTQKKQQAEAAPDDEGLKQQLAAAALELEKAREQQKAAQEAVTAATARVETIAAELKKAQEEKSKADQDQREAQTFQQQAQQEKQRADQFYNQKRNESNRRGINVSVPSNNLTVTVTEFPVKVESSPERVELVQGEKKEVVVRIARLYDFKGNVSLQSQFPGGVSGIQIASQNIADSATEAKFDIVTQANATVGEHECRLRLQMNFNGQNLILEKPVVIAISEAAAK